MQSTITTKIFRDDLDTLRELKRKHRLAGIADTITYLLDQHEGRSHPPRNVHLVLEEPQPGELRVRLVETKN